MHDHPFQLSNEITHAIFISSGTIPLVTDKLSEQGLLVKPGKTEHQNSIIPEHGTPEH